MVTARTSFTDESDKRKYVLQCEAEFEKKLDEAVAKILSDKNNKLITLSGPTCAGKTTLAKKIVSEFDERGSRVHIVSIDDFYFDRDFLLSKAESESDIDFDSAETIDLERLKVAVEQIFAGERVVIPQFDFKTGKRVAEREFTCDERDIFVFEGIQAVYPEVTSLFGSHPYVSVGISVLDSLQVGDFVYTPTEIRLLRRLVRDYNFRNATAEFTLNLWKNVRKNEDKNIFPYLPDCKILLNSLMPYEISMLKAYILPILKLIPQNSEYHEFALEEIKKFKHIDKISRKYIPECSLYHEFLG